MRYCSRGNRINPAKDLYDLYFPFFISAVIIRLLITLVKPYEIDMAGYVAWSNYLASYGPANFYNGSGFHVVYAPFFSIFSGLQENLLRHFLFQQPQLLT